MKRCLSGDGCSLRSSAENLVLKIPYYLIRIPDTPQEISEEKLNRMNTEAFSAAGVYLAVVFAYNRIDYYNRKIHDTKISANEEFQKGGG